jgi:hypothetical protein
MSLSGGGDEARFSLLARPLPRTFRTRVVTIDPARSLVCDDADWGDAIVVVERGVVELETAYGGRCWLRAGDVFWLAGLRVRAMHSVGSEPAVLAAASRGWRAPPRLARVPATIAGRRDDLVRPLAGFGGVLLR